METILNPSTGQPRCLVSDNSHVAAARRAAGDLAARLGFDPVRSGELAIVVTEAASNILKHAGHGEILLRPLRVGGHAGVEVLAIDHGPGMANLPASMEDGRSTAGSYGVGLGAMLRLSSTMDVFCAPGQGCVIALTLWPRGAAEREALDAPLRLGVVCQPMAGETECGDGWALAHDATWATVLVADGLGHGPLAADAARAALHSAMERPERTATALMEDAHAALRATRGAALAIVRIDMLAEQLRMAGIGNIAVQAWHDGERRQLVSHNGIVGSNMRKVQEFGAGWGGNGMLILHSDGLNTRWNLDDYRGLADCHPAVVAAVLYRDFTRGRDDVTVLVLRDRRGMHS
ncbi:ATP-binding SpoIIE family protein phosphatase [Pseudoduganella namucuonensis]|uniref:Anti-sigma regulatory factor (Ser/Thr protein kinase) n=1 Tax=Pseudoduganella namucuonensis TaxID=1035707 RepID=A0A1I7HEI4_9BURK|nr:ATP-binding SpoIIE family protein phosphatase [Pseudoduganella namucuonensis]SFU59052.1 Anti-sigma regulatory factor (Ser/Thr protein kinase) [Pseudoduganella namucuonensis]